MTYIILNSVDLTQQMVDDCVQTSLSSVRKSLDETQAVLKYEGTQPSSVSGYTEYTHTEILAILAGATWQSEGP